MFRSFQMHVSVPHFTGEKAALLVSVLVLSVFPDIPMKNMLWSGSIRDQRNDEHEQYNIIYGYVQAQL